MADRTIGSGDARPGPAAAPPARSRLAGRERELKELRADIVRAGLDTLSGRAPARSRVLLIAGRPGSGRTALAEELARSVADDYPGGLLRARLTEPGGAPPPLEDIARDLLTELGGSAPAGSSEDELTQAVRDALAGRRCVLLLDDAADPDPVHELVPDTPGCLVVAVSEGPLTGVPDVRPCTLGGLPVPAAVALLARYAGDTRVTVDPRAAETLVEECAGQPAALLLAGGWLAARPTASVADAVLGMRGLPPGAGAAAGPAGRPGAVVPGNGRRRPLERAFRLAHAALPGAAAALLPLLTLAPAGRADAQTASSLAGCSLAEAQSLLDELAARCLLRPVPGPVSGAARYDLPGCLVPLLREVLETRVKPAEAGLARARMLERTVRQLRACRAETERDEPAARAWLAELPRGLRFGSRRAAREWLDARLPVLRAAVRLAVDDGGLDSQARRLLSALARAVMAHRGEEASAAELYPLHQLALEVAERRGLVPEQAAAHLNLADLDAAAGRTEDALARYRSALAAAREADEPFLTGRSLESLGRVYGELGDWERAADWYGRALALRLARGDAAEEARLYGRMATVHEHTGDRAEILRNLRAAAAAARRAGDRSLESGIRTRLAGAFDLLGDPEAAAAQRAAAQRLRGKAEQ